MQTRVRVECMAEPAKHQITIPAANRVAYIDWVRGFACVMMFQTHCYDSWLGGSARESGFFKLSQFGGTLPAPLFLFLAGVSMAMVTDRLRQKGASADEIARTTIRRGGEIFLLALLFRVQEFLLGYRGAQWPDLLRVDVLNIIGLSLILMAVMCRVAAAGSVHDVRKLRLSSGLMAIAAAAAIALATPPLWTTVQPRWMPWWIESYINGVHTFDKPQTYLFPMFPWAAFAFAGLAVGFFLLSDWARAHVAASVAAVAGTGLALIYIGKWLDANPIQLYAEYDFWHTSPNFFVIRAGVVMLILWGGYLWCRWGAGQWGFSPLIEMGKSSLLVYWVHMEFVYGGFSILPKRGVTVERATLGLLAITIAMTLLATFRNRFSGRGMQFVGFLRRMPEAFPGR
jgi:uncharacterized membrane protein